MHLAVSRDACRIEIDFRYLRSVANAGREKLGKVTLDLCEERIYIGRLGSGELKPFTATANLKAMPAVEKRHLAVTVVSSELGNAGAMKPPDILSNLSPRPAERQLGEESFAGQYGCVHRISSVMLIAVSR